MKCENCGANLTAQQCAYCGSRQKEQPQPQVHEHHYYYHQTYSQEPQTSPKNRWVALLLCLLLGMIGAHKFYVGKIGMGFLYLFTGGLFGVGWMVDCIFILLGVSTDKQGRKLV